MHHAWPCTRVNSAHPCLTARKKCLPTVQRSKESIADGNVTLPTYLSAPLLAKLTANAIRTLEEPASEVKERCQVRPAVYLLGYTGSV